MRSCAATLLKYVTQQGTQQPKRQPLPDRRPRLPRHVDAHVEVDPHLVPMLSRSTCSRPSSTCATPAAFGVTTSFLAHAAHEATPGGASCACQWCSLVPTAPSLRGPRKAILKIEPPKQHSTPLRVAGSYPGHCGGTCPRLSDGVADGPGAGSIRHLQTRLLVAADHGTGPLRPQSSGHFPSLCTPVRGGPCSIAPRGRHWQRASAP